MDPLSTNSNLRTETMKHLKITLCICASLITIPVAVNAKSYAGFDLCGPASPASIKSAIEGAGGAVVRVVDQTYPDETIVIAKNFPVDVSPRSVSVTLYKGKIAYISIGNAGDMVQGIETKYGTNFTVSKKEEKVGKTTSHHFKDPSDDTLELTISQFEIANNKGTFFSVNYACKDLYQQVEKSRQGNASQEKKK
jgi:hypothetical protein